MTTDLARRLVEVNEKNEIAPRRIEDVIISMIP